MTFCPTFLIDNLTSYLDPVFFKPIFSYMESHLGFHTNFIFPFHSKTKICIDSKSFQIRFFKIEKTSLSTIPKMKGPQNDDSIGLFTGSSLNTNWGNCGV